ncbi:MAG: MoaD/ThiS family protein [Thermoplasmatota archaeon]
MEVRLYGDLREYGEKFDEQSESIGLLDITPEGIETVRELLEYLKIDSSEVSHIFVNREYSSIEKQVSSDDRVAIFPKDMALLYKWYFNKSE